MRPITLQVTAILILAAAAGAPPEVEAEGPATQAATEQERIIRPNWEPDLRFLSVLANLGSPDHRARNDAVWSVMSEREAIIKRLAEIVSQDDSAQYVTPNRRYFSPKSSAIHLLGRLRADDDHAMRVLWENLKYEASIPAGSLNQLFDPGNRYPAAAGLVEIGKPACERALQELESTDDPIRRDLAAYIVYRVEGAEVAQQLINKKLERYSDWPQNATQYIQAKRNLDQAHQWIEDRITGAHPPTIGGKTMGSQTRPSAGSMATVPMDTAEGLRMFREHPEGIRIEAARLVRPLIKMGMTKREVEELLGRPNRELRNGSVWSYTIFWSQWIDVYFDKREQVSSIHSTLDTGPASRSTD